MLAARHRAAPRRSPVALRPAVLVTALVVAVVGCTPGATSSEQDDGETADDQPPAATVTIPAIRLSPFCQAMIELDERLRDDPPDDVEAEIIATYEGIEDEVPDAIRDDFTAVLASLRGDDPPTTSEVPTTAPVGPSGAPVTDAGGSAVPAGDPFFDEGYDPDDDPALRLNAYVDFECRDVANNPGPPPTQPLSEPTTTDG